MDFRLAQAITPARGEIDRRLCDVVLYFAKERAPFPWSQLRTCGFFTYRGAANTSARRDTPFITQKATRFEQLLFFYFACQLYESSRSGRAKHGRDGRLINQVIPPSFERDTMDRIAYAIQSIVRAWDVFSKCYSFSSAENMLLPFLLFGINSELCMPEVCATTVYARRSPLSNRTRITEDDDFIEVSDLPSKESQPNEYARQIYYLHLAGAFLEDIRKITSNEMLYQITKTLHGLSQKEEGPQSWPLFKAFHSNTSEPAPRFHDFILDNRQLLLNETIVKKLLAKKDEESSKAEAEKQPPKKKKAKAIDPTTQLRLDDAERAISFELTEFIRMHNCSFEDIIDVDYNESGVDGALDETAQLLLCDPPWGVRKADYDRFEVSEMEKFIDLASKVLRKGGHAIIFCSIQQFRDWYDKACDHKTNRQATFSVDRQAMHFQRHNSWYLSPPARSSCALHSNSELALHMKKNGLPYEIEKTMVNYRHFGHVQSTCLPYDNTIDNVRGPLRGEQVMVSNGDSGRMRHLRPEQKGIAFLQELIERFSQPGDLVVDFCSGTFSTGLACLLLPRYRIFIGCEKDSDCTKAARSHVYRRLAHFVTHDRPRFQVTSRLERAAKTFVNGEELKDLESNWKAPNGYPPYQTFPRHLLLYAANTFSTNDYMNYVNEPIDQWSPVHRGNFNIISWQDLPFIEATRLGLILKPSDIKNRFAGTGVFAARQIQKGEVVGYYYGSVVYHNLWRRKQTTKTYGEGILGVTSVEFRKYALLATVESCNFPEVKDQTEDRRLSVNIVPARFCTMRYINSPKYLENDEEYEDFKKEKIQEPRTANVKFVRTLAEYPSSLTSFEYTPVEAIRDIAYGEEIYVDYGSDDMLPNPSSRE